MEARQAYPEAQFSPGEDVRKDLLQWGTDKGAKDSAITGCLTQLHEHGIQRGCDPLQRVDERTVQIEQDGLV